MTCKGKGLPVYVGFPLALASIFSSSLGSSAGRPARILSALRFFLARSNSTRLGGGGAIWVGRN